MQEVFTKEIEELIPHRSPFLLIEYVRVFPEQEIAISKCNRRILEEIRYLKGEQISLFYFIEGICQTAGVIFNLLHNDDRGIKKKKFLSRLDEMKILGDLCLSQELTFKVEVKSSNRFNDKFYGEILSNNNPVLRCNVTSSAQIL
jgi:3-hydroxymyristoyl/3-hydroxydecanoyl-(acyl carrier protein) dehydratase